MGGYEDYDYDIIYVRPTASNWMWRDERCASITQNILAMHHSTWVALLVSSELVGSSTIFGSESELLPRIENAAAMISPPLGAACGSGKCWSYFSRSTP
jgi:hypothetical protein